MSFAKEVWDTFSSLNVNKHTDKRGQFTFLSWTWAWDVLMSEYPASTYEYSDVVAIGETVEVRVSVTVRKGEDELTRSMWLPVMDYHNKAITNPSSREVSDSRMRCLVKCLAMFGLGHYIYAGEDLPNKPEAPKKNVSHETPPTANLATAAQKLLIKDFKGENKLPARWVSWCSNKENWENMTNANAESILSDCRKKDKE